mmetsp:Transcript_686/g.2390  ORF Transcript_686/g.2390 Transcript_686/m.2390 type:complete len:211 (+) Transcript_686:635-1267(+)
MGTISQRHSRGFLWWFAQSRTGTRIVCSLSSSASDVSWPGTAALKDRLCIAATALRNVSRRKSVGIKGKSLASTAMSASSSLTTFQSCSKSSAALRAVSRTCDPFSSFSRVASSHHVGDSSKSSRSRSQWYGAHVLYWIVERMCSASKVTLMARATSPRGMRRRDAASPLTLPFSPPSSSPSASHLGFEGAVCASMNGPMRSSLSAPAAV